MKSDVIDQEIKKVREDAAKKVARLRELRAVAADAQEAYEDLLDSEGFKAGYDYSDPRLELVRPHAVTWFSGTFIALSLRGCLAFQDAAPILEALGQRGYAVKKIEDDADIKRRVYSFGKDLKVMAFLTYNEEKVTCKLVATGETAPVMKFSCEETVEEINASIGVGVSA